ncbi:MAG: glucose-6-phosphate dehydrogenase assembly protein OpcA [Deltaproteobacteria bacterium]|nr:glucose-6-phosphate dehydrogenase assembly protein OpcA [Deltaproteobacteria bacterium]
MNTRESIPDTSNAEASHAGASNARASDSAQTVEQFSRGTRFRVEPERIERALASLWQAARTEDHRQSVTRACLWNLIIHIEEREGREGFGGCEALNAMIPMLPRFIASRTLIVRTKDGAQPGEEDLETFISANCVLGPDGKKQVCSEEITIVARSLGDRHVPALVRALIVPSIPSALVVAGLPPEGEPMIAGLVHTLDRVLIDLNASDSLSPLGRTMALMDALPAGLTDLGWIEDAPMRRAVATLFDDQNIARRLNSVREIRYTTSRGRQRSAHLFIAWIAGCLSTRPIARRSPNHWTIDATRAQNAGVEVEIELRLELSGPERTEAEDVLEFIDVKGHRLGLITRSDGNISITAHVNPDSDSDSDSDSDKGATMGRKTRQRTQVRPSTARDIAAGLSSRADDDFLRRALFIARGM